MRAWRLLTMPFSALTWTFEEFTTKMSGAVVGSNSHREPFVHEWVEIREMRWCGEIPLSAADERRYTGSTTTTAKTLYSRKSGAVTYGSAGTPWIKHCET